MNHNNSTQGDIMSNEMNMEQIIEKFEILKDETADLKVEIARLNKEIVNSYIAGFNDGEGCIKITKRGHLMSALTNTDLNILIKMKQVFGGNVYVVTKDVIDRKDKWQWHISDRASLKIFLEAILPYSTVKRQQIIYVLKYLELTSNLLGKSMSPEEQKIREFFYDKLKDMKDVEYSKDELKIFEDKITSLNKNSNQPSLMDY